MSDTDQHENYPTSMPGKSTARDAARPQPEGGLARRRPAALSTARTALPNYDVSPSSSSSSSASLQPSSAVFRPAPAPPSAISSGNIGSTTPSARRKTNERQAQRERQDSPAHTPRPASAGIQNRLRSSSRRNSLHTPPKPAPAAATTGDLKTDSEENQGGDLDYEQHEHIVGSGQGDREADESSSSDVANEPEDLGHATTSGDTMGLLQPLSLILHNSQAALASSWTATRGQATALRQYIPVNIHLEIQWLVASIWDNVIFILRSILTVVQITWSWGRYPAVLLLLMWLFLWLSLDAAIWVVEGVHDRVCYMTSMVPYLDQLAICDIQYKRGSHQIPVSDALTNVTLGVVNILPANASESSLSKTIGLAASGFETLDIILRHSPTPQEKALAPRCDKAGMALRKAEDDAMLLTANIDVFARLILTHGLSTNLEALDRAKTADELLALRHPVAAIMEDKLLPYLGIRRPGHSSAELHADAVDNLLALIDDIVNWIDTADRSAADILEAITNSLVTSRYIEGVIIGHRLESSSKLDNLLDDWWPWSMLHRKDRMIAQRDLQRVDQSVFLLKNTSGTLQKSRQFMGGWRAGLVAYRKLLIDKRLGAEQAVSCILGWESTPKKTTGEVDRGRCSLLTASAEFHVEMMRNATDALQKHLSLHIA